MQLEMNRMASACFVLYALTLVTWGGFVLLEFVMLFFGGVFNLEAIVAFIEIPMFFAFSAVVFSEIR